MISLPSHATVRVSCAAAALLALSACGGLSERLPSVSSLVTPYQIDILQGNVVTREQIQALKTGMPREQVRDVLGSPLLASVFHADRWDYVFTLRRQGQEPQRRRVAVFFKGDTLERFEADELPTEAEFVASLDARRGTGKVPELVATEAQLKAFADRNKPQAPPTPTAAATEPSTTNFPPLESGAAR